MSSSDQKRALIRKEYRDKRRRISVVEQQHAAEALLQRCLDFPRFLHAKRVACYLANDGEINTQALIEHCWQQNIDLLLPIICPDNPGHLLFLTHRVQWPLQQNKYGIAEPVFDKNKVVPLNEIDILFTPLVAFDKQGNRLGMGGGYYDRTLANLSTHSTNLCIVGLAHNCQQSENLPVQSWDIPLHYIITPTQIFTL